MSRSVKMVPNVSKPHEVLTWFRWGCRHWPGPARRCRSTPVLQGWIYAWKRRDLTGSPETWAQTTENTTQSKYLIHKPPLHISTTLLKPRNLIQFFNTWNCQRLLYVEICINDGTQTHTQTVRKITETAKDTQTCSLVRYKQQNTA